MPTADLPGRCRAARAWLSAFRDGEVFDDPGARDHLDACGACAAWAETLDALIPRMRLRRTGSPDVVAAALAEWQRRAATGPRRQGTAGRVLLVVAGAAGLALAALGIAGLPGVFQAPDHLGWELYSFEAALALGFLLAARRPDRYARALVPPVAAVVALTLLPVFFDVAVSRADPLAEASHLPVLAGLIGLLLHLDFVSRSDGGRRTGDGSTAPGGATA